MSAVKLRPDDLRELYRELILDHAKSPRHFGKLANATHTAHGINPLCGDKLTLYLALDEDNVRDAAFEGSGCAISVASASLLTETIVGTPIETALDYFAAVTSRLTSGESAVVSAQDLDLDKLRALEGVREFPSRVKCATLAWHALHSAIHEQSTPVSTE
ncbi:MAG: SUF system NifU family Fe-S cluster assembly protein [Woeseiaceae bacterium]|nr:SUF system NifU family Fe-S cluster assembly protein [Woeseiaceae bacterium]